MWKMGWSLSTIRGSSFELLVDSRRVMFVGGGGLKDRHGGGFAQERVVGFGGSLKLRWMVLGAFADFTSVSRKYSGQRISHMLILWWYCVRNHTHYIYVFEYNDILAAEIMDYSLASVVGQREDH